MMLAQGTKGSLKLASDQGYKRGRGIGNEKFRVDYGGTLHVIGRGQIPEAFLM